ncbi:hypothetical protein [Nocardia xishanensis]|uniref:hypothetical protein n=1 Tax=Nocardia xishanensis TaxID=238964 RepID=UPI0012F4C6DE|nr:hypothetical protein [Nocardia xishanensis]
MSAIAVAHATAQFTAVGDLSAIGAPAVTAGFSGVGEFSVPMNEGDALFEAVGALAVSATPSCTATFSGTGILSALGVPAATAALSGAGTLSATGYPTATVAFSGAGTLSATAVTFSPSGMTKNGTQTWAVNSTWTTITSWTANTGTYPGSSVDGSHRLVVQGSKSNATVAAQVPFTGSFGGTHQIRVVDQNGTVIGSAGSGVSGNSGTCTVTVNNVNLASITAIGVQMFCDGASSTGTVTSGATSFLTIT